MKNVQKLVLVPVERWEKIGDNIPMKQVSVTSVTLEAPTPSFTSHSLRCRFHFSARLWPKL